MSARGTLLAACALVAVLGGGYVVARYARADGPEEPPPTEPLEPEPADPGGRRPIPADALPLDAPGADPRWIRANNEATEALAAGEHERAIGLLEPCVAAHPEIPAFVHNLAEALARRARELQEEGRMEDALAALARAVDVDAEREDLAELLARWREQHAVERDFWSDQSQNFELSYDGDRAEILHGSQPLIDALERGYADFRELFGVDPVATGEPRVRVVLYRDEEFDRLTGLGDWAGGVFDGTVRIPVRDLGRERSRLGRVLRHELAHYFTREVGGNAVPGWLDEGLAQWLEGGTASALATARAQLAGEPLFSLDRLEGSLATWSDQDEIRRAYAQSLAFVDHLARNYGDALLFELVAGCGAGRSCAQTFRGRWGFELTTALDDLRQDL